MQLENTIFSAFVHDFELPTARMAPRNPYPHWHKIYETLPLLTLCGTEISQKGTLAVLAYAYCRQFECPPPGLILLAPLAPFRQFLLLLFKGKMVMGGRTEIAIPQLCCDHAAGCDRGQI